MSHRIRRAAPHDAAAITEMIHALAEFERAADQCTVTETRLAAALFDASPTVHGHVAEVDGTIAGMALWFVNFSTWDGVAGIYLEDLFVRPGFRRRGLARALLAALAAECVRRGYTRLSWAVLNWNTAQLSLGQASLVGALSVPPTWGATGAAITPLAATTQVGLGAYHGFGSATPMVMEEAGAVGMPGVPLAGLPGAHEDEFSEPMYGFRPRIIGRPPAAG